MTMCSLFLMELDRKITKCCDRTLDPPEAGWGIMWFATCTFALPNPP
ncbi:hypothetical protein IQ270_10685 [Microcoleus sp. LEGE 07076]|nr:hypothetical protein [Microcoleus sp. LEGE 07076]MBE9185170.1 hypothetical protein [Microcoleus sp. LEGE 07076]